MSGFAPRLYPIEYGFAGLGAPCPSSLTPLATFAEDEGLTIVAPVAELEAHGIAHQPGFARISLGLATQLEAVGVTAAISGALAEAGISCNMLAAFHHDHLFVPWRRRDEALEIVSDLKI